MYVSVITQPLCEYTIYACFFQQQCPGITDQTDLGQAANIMKKYKC